MALKADLQAEADAAGIEYKAKDTIKTLKALLSVGGYDGTSTPRAWPVQPIANVPQTAQGIRDGMARGETWPRNK